ncbi:ABC transporter permease [Sulfuricella sp.]|uniref:ABC transporter permease n=1 Tax=Sulfuricella sp. TaxID=2099377 RepID=UPI002D7F658C|nr:ABC transporter permease [Sulfuricella sp.]
MFVKFLLALLHRNAAADLAAFKLTAVRMLVQPAVYLFVFGYVVGGMLPAQGGGYARIMAPGIVAISVVTGPFVTIGGGVISGYYFRTMEEWLLAPVPLRTLLAALVFNGLCYGLAGGTVVAALVWAILGLAPQNVGYMVLTATAGALLFSLFTLVVLLVPETPDKGQEVFSFLMMPMTFFGCTFYSYDMLGAPFNYLALLLPTTYIAEGLRAAYSPDSPHMEAGTVLAGLSLAAAVLIPLADWAFRRRFRDFTW